MHDKGLSDRFLLGAHRHPRMVYDALLILHKYINRGRRRAGALKFGRLQTPHRYGGRIQLTLRLKATCFREMSASQSPDGFDEDVRAIDAQIWR
jgi:hypothetical protein